MEVTMRKVLTAAMAALTLGGGVAATAVPAQAAPWGGGWHGGGWHGGGWHGGGPGPAIFAGNAGLAIGAAIANNHPYYGPGYYDGYYGGPYGYGACYGPTRVWDPYVG